MSTMKPSDSMAFAIPTRYSTLRDPQRISGFVKKVESVATYPTKEITVSVDASANDDEGESHVSEGWGHYTHASGCHTSARSNDFESVNEGEYESVTSDGDFFDVPFADDETETHSHRHSCPEIIDTERSDPQLRAEQRLISLKLKHAELQTHLGRVENSVKRTSQENLLLKEQVEDALAERDRAMSEVQKAIDQVGQLTSMVESLRVSTERLTRERDELKSKVEATNSGRKQKSRVRRRFHSNSLVMTV